MRKTTRQYGRKVYKDNGNGNKISNLTESVVSGVKSTGSKSKSTGSKSSSNTKSSGSNLSSSSGGKVQLGTNKMAAQALHPEAEEMLTNLFATYGLEFRRVALQDESFPEYVASINRICEIVKTNIKLLPKMLENTAILMKGQVDLAKYYEAQTALLTRGQGEIDKATVKSFLHLAGYNKQKDYLQQKLNQKLQVLETGNEAKISMCSEGAQSAMRMIQMKSQAGAQRITQSESTYQNRQNLLAAASNRRRERIETGKYGHLQDADKV